MVETEIEIASLHIIIQPTTTVHIWRGGRLLMIIVQHNLLSKKEYLYRKYIYNIISIYIRFITKTIFM